MASTRTYILYDELIGICRVTELERRWPTKRKGFRSEFFRNTSRLNRDGGKGGGGHRDHWGGGRDGGIGGGGHADGD